mmetsp:Transcript_19436/g.35234  ORF Transcript_19436/g.35234 Transcript_19436/m.35234 type:complete len:186 (+) Transcript_19436:53-610(+)
MGCVHGTQVANELRGSSHDTPHRSAEVYMEASGTEDSFGRPNKRRAAKIESLRRARRAKAQSSVEDSKGSTRLTASTCTSAMSADDEQTPLSIGSSMTLSCTRSEYYASARGPLDPDYTTTDSYISELNQFLEALESDPSWLERVVRDARELHDQIRAAQDLLADCIIDVPCMKGACTSRARMHL